MRNDLLQALRSARSTWPTINLLDRGTFVRNLIFVHGVITASEKLLETAARESRRPLRDYFEAHLEEERGHAQWLADDLRSASIDVSKMDISSDALAMAGSQYYLIYHVDAAAFLGYMAALECFPTTAEMVSELEATHGAALCRTLRYHATHDADHGDGVLAQIDRLDVRQFELAMQNAVRTAMHIRSAILKM